MLVWKKRTVKSREVTRKLVVFLLERTGISFVWVSIDRETWRALNNTTDRFADCFTA